MVDDMRLRVAAFASLLIAVAGCGVTHYSDVSSPPHNAEPPSANATLTGVLMTTRGRGLVVTGQSPATGTVSVTGTSRKTVAVSDAKSGFTITLTPGTYVLTGSILDGSCAPLPLRVTSTARVAVNLSCHDGYSTF
jgi:hypothetical protein